MKKTFFSFTLAEVLITLGIIGIIAEITIPTLMQNMARQQYATLTQKAWSETSQFLKMYMTNQGVSSICDTDLADGNNLEAAIRQYFKVVKVCTDPADTSCDIYEKYLSKSGGLTNAFTPINNSTNYRYVFVLTNGMEISMTLYVSSGSLCRTVAYPNAGKIQNYFGVFLVDVNGSKGPNQHGRDYQQSFFIGQDGNLYPLAGIEYAKAQSGDTLSTTYWRNRPELCGSPGSSDLSNGGIGEWGQACVARMMENGWVMDY